MPMVLVGSCRAYSRQASATGHSAQMVRAKVMLVWVSSMKIVVSWRRQAAWSMKSVLAAPKPVMLLLVGIDDSPELLGYPLGDGCCDSVSALFVSVAVGLSCCVVVGPSHQAFTFDGCEFSGWLCWSSDARSADSFEWRQLVEGGDVSFAVCAVEPNEVLILLAIPFFALGDRKYFKSTLSGGCRIKDSDEEDASSPLGDSEMLCVQHGPFDDQRPAVGQVVKDGCEVCSFIA